MKREEYMDESAEENDYNEQSNESRGRERIVRAYRSSYRIKIKW